MTMLRIDDVKKETGHRSHVSIYGQVKAGTFTKPVAIGSRAVAWPSHEVAAINAARVAGRSNEELRDLVERLHARRAQMAEEAAA